MRKYEGLGMYMESVLTWTNDQNVAGLFDINNALFLAGVYDNRTHDKLFEAIWRMVYGEDYPTWKARIIGAGDF